MGNNVFIYCLNKEDRIISVCENWSVFAHKNSWAGKCTPENVIEHKLWAFIQDDTTHYLYQEIFKKVRAGQHLSPIPFRCDSPEQRRFLELEFTLLADGHVQITSTILNCEDREYVSLLDSAIEKTDELIRICSMCKKIAVSRDSWVEIETGLRKLKVFEKTRHPNCPTVYVQSALAQP